MDSGIESGRKYYKFCPYARFDTESMERWLNERADEGYVLSRRGFIGPFGIFFKGTRPMRYQILTEMFDANIYRDMVQTMEDNGWYHVIEEERSRMNIFVTDDPGAVDLHTDPEIERIERNLGGAQMSRRYFGSYIVVPLVYFIFYIAINNAFGDAGSSPVKNSALILALVLVATLYFPVGVSAVLRQRLNKLRRERGVQLSDVEYKRRAVGRTLMWILIPVLAVAELIVGFQIINNLG